MAVCMRPGLARAMSTLSHVCQNPQVFHSEVAKRVLRFVKGTTKKGLGYSPREDIAIWEYRDASMVAMQRLSGRGLIFFLMSGGGAIS